MRIKFISFVLISLFLIMPHLIHAQFSLKPKPLPDCKYFLISEIGAFYRITSAPDGKHKFSEYYVSNMGLMVNLSKDYSLGATTFVSLKRYKLDTFFRFGLKARGRRWLGSKNSINLAAGIILYDEDRGYKSPAFSGDMSLNIHDSFVIEVLMEIVPYDYYQRRYSEAEQKYVRGPRIKGSDLGIYTGIKIGSLPGLVGNLIAGVVGGILYIFVRG